MSLDRFGMDFFEYCSILGYRYIGVAPFAVTHVRNKNSNIQGKSPNVVKVIYHTIRNCS